MITAILIFVFTIFLSNSSLAANPHQNFTKLDHAIQLSTNYLTQQFDKDEYKLACYSSGDISCPVPNTGNPLLLYYFFLATGDTLSASIKQKMAKIILEEKKRMRWLWGYDKDVIIDSDDTSYALSTLRLLQQPISLSNLSLFYKPNLNAYTTFLTSDYIGLVSDISYINNNGAHIEVNANIFNLFEHTGKKDRINYDLFIKTQNKQGYWQGYFYPSRYFTTYLVMKLLCKNPSYVSAKNNGVAFLINSQKNDGSWGNPSNPFDTALAINTLLLCSPKNTNPLTSGANYLISSQNKNGSWDNASPIWTFKFQDNPDVVWSAFDSYEFLTTSLALQALKKYKATLHSN